MIIQNKSQLRAELLNKRRAIAPKERRLAGESALLSLKNIVPKDAVAAAYWPMADEFDVQSIINWLHENNITCVLPCIAAKDKPLLFRRYAKGDVLAKKFIPEPPENSPLLTPDIILVPMVGFDRRGYRLGMGGGFYDRTLAATSAKTIGVAFAATEVEKIPAEPHDIRMHAILTEKELIEIAP